MCGCGKVFGIWPDSSPCWFFNYQHALVAYSQGGTAQEAAKRFFEAYEAARRRRSPGRPRKDRDGYIPVFGQFGADCY